jgi:hypothetical protein
MVHQLQGMQDVPDGLLADIIGRLPLSDRIKAAELVCKRFRRIAWSNQLHRTLDLSQDPLWHHRVTMGVLQHLIDRSMQSTEQGRQPSPVTHVVLRNCKANKALPIQLVQQCLQFCPSVQEVDATGFGGLDGYFHLNDLMSLLRAFNRERRLQKQVKAVWVDVHCYGLGDPWESTAYQRAINCDALWLTFMRFLEPRSPIRVRNIIFSGRNPHTEGPELTEASMSNLIKSRMNDLLRATQHSGVCHQVKLVPCSALERRLLEAQQHKQWHSGCAKITIEDHC